jgi:hypothetical protein
VEHSTPPLSFRPLVKFAKFAKLPSQQVQTPPLAAFRQFRQIGGPVEQPSWNIHVQPPPPLSFRPLAKFAKFAKLPSQQVQTPPLAAFRQFRQIGIRPWNIHVSHPAGSRLRLH